MASTRKGSIERFVIKISYLDWDQRETIKWSIDEHDISNFVVASRQMNYSRENKREDWEGSRREMRAPRRGNWKRG